MQAAPRGPLGEEFTKLLRTSVLRPLAAMLLLGGLFIAQIGLLLSLTSWVEHTDQLISQSNGLMKQYEYAVAGFRSYVAYRDPEDLEEYRSSIPRVQQSVDQLRANASSGSEQIRLTDEIHAGLTEWISKSEAFISGNSQSGGNEALPRNGRPITPQARPLDKKALQELRDLRNRNRARIESFVSTQEQLRVRRVDLESSVTAGILLLSVLLCMALGTFLAITARRQLQELSRNYENALALRDDFISIASHELKTPVTSLQLQLQVVQSRLERFRERSPESVSFQRSVNIFARQTQRLTLLIESLLDLSQIQSKRFKVEPLPFRLNPFLQSIVHSQSSAFEQVGSTLTLSDPQDIEVHWDRRRIEQAISNILSNAIKYAPGTPVEILTRAIDRSSVRIDIIDRGPGISDEMQSRIFQRFARGHDFEKVTGMGLGLFIAQEIIKAHGGRISVQAVFPGPGTCFTLEIPQRAVVSEPQAPLASQGSQVSQESQISGVPGGTPEEKPALVERDRHIRRDTPARRAS